MLPKCSSHERDINPAAWDSLLGRFCNVQQLYKTRNIQIVENQVLICTVFSQLKSPNDEHMLGKHRKRSGSSCQYLCLLRNKRWCANLFFGTKYSVGRIHWNRSVPPNEHCQIYSEVIRTESVKTYPLVRELYKGSPVGCKHMFSRETLRHPLILGRKLISDFTM